MSVETNDKFNWFWRSAYPDVAKYIDYIRIAAKSWTDSTPATYKEIGSIGEMHRQNLFATLKTDEGRKHYAKTLDLPSAIAVDLDNEQPTTPPNEMETKQQPQADKMERTFLVNCTKEQLIALGNYMFDNGIFFAKCSDTINQAAHKETFPAAQAEETDGTVRP